MKLDVIFVTYNHEHIIRECYEKVKKELKESKHRIYFVDNCSTDDTLEELQKIYELYIFYAKGREISRPSFAICI